jgi:drug/metabolite transporter (DMT)-like permease
MTPKAESPGFEPEIENRHLSPGMLLFGVLLCVVFGANAIAIKVSLQGVGPLTAAGLRFGLASLAIGLWAHTTGEPLRVPPNRTRALLILSAIFVVQLGLFYLGLNLTYASRAILVSNLMPFILLILAHYFIPGDRITGRKVVGMVLGFSGLLFVVLEKPTSGVGGLRAGDLLVLGSAGLWAVSAVFIKRISPYYTSYHLSVYPMVFSFPLFLLAGFFSDGGMVRHLDVPVVAALFYQVFTASFGSVGWNHLLKNYGATSLHTLVFIMPVVGVLLGGTVLGEPITRHIFLSMVLVAAGILIANLKHPTPTAPFRPQL